MSKGGRPVLRAPLKELLDDELPEAQVQRIWRKLDGTPARRPRDNWLRSQLWAAVAVIVFSVGTGSWLYLGTRPAALAVQGADTLAPSRTLGGVAASRYQLTDGSVVQLDAAARLEVLANDGQAFAVRLSTGRVRFDVKPGGPRRWKIDCGELDVEVVGTSFSIDRAGAGVGVRVDHGVVVVRGVRVPGGKQRLGAGERLYVASANAAPTTAVTPQPTAPPAASSAVAPPVTQLGAGLQLETETPDRSQPLAAGDARAMTPRANEPRFDDTSRPTAAELAGWLRRADHARKADRSIEAQAILERVRIAAPETSHAAIASLTLARMRILSAPALAAADLEAALAGRLPEALREDALARKVEAQARAGDADGARAAAAAYSQAFPRGRRAAEVDRWIAAP